MSGSLRDYARRLRRSQDPIERRSLFHGLVYPEGAPALVPIELWKENVWFRGDPGSGKTAQMVAMMEQLLAIEPATVHIFDMKGSPELFAAAMALRPDATRWFIDRVGYSTHVFNPLQQPLWQLLTPSQRSDVFLAASETDYGGSTVYGQHYFSARNKEILGAVLNRIRNPKNFAMLVEQMPAALKAAKVDAEARRAGAHARLVCEGFAEVQALNAENSIDLLDGFRVPQIVYWCLPTDIGGKTAASICRFATSMLLTGASLVDHANRVPVYIFVDEFQRALGARFIDLISTARSKEVSCVFAHQSLGQLAHLGAGAIRTLFNCCRVQWLFALGDPQEQIDVSRESGEVVDTLRTFQETLLGDVLIHRREAFRPRLPLNAVKDASATPLRTLLRCTRNAGYWQHNDRWMPVQSFFHIDRDEFERRKRFPWPGPAPGTITTTMPKPPGDDELPPGLFPPKRRGDRKPPPPPGA